MLRTFGAGALALAMTLLTLDPAAAKAAGPASCPKYRIVVTIGGVGIVRCVYAPAPKARQRHSDMITDFSASRRQGRSRSYRAHHHVHRYVAHARGGHGNLCTAQGRCATVASFAVGAFRGLVSDLEQLGYAIGSPGCLSGGHMRNSKHHWGGACDLFNQVARNRTALRQPPPAVQIEVAQRHGLISGCSWHRSPDCGHFEISRR